MFHRSHSHDRLDHERRASCVASSWMVMGRYPSPRVREYVTC